MKQANATVWGYVNKPDLKKLECISCRKKSSSCKTIDVILKTSIGYPFYSHFFGYCSVQK